MKRKIANVFIFIITLFLLSGCGFSKVDINVSDTYQKKLKQEKLDSENSYFLGGDSDVGYMDTDTLIKCVGDQEGCSVITIPIAWGMVEQEPGNYDYSVYEEKIEELVSRGYKLIIILDGGGRNILDEGKIVNNSIPGWFFEKYPEAQAINFYGEKVSSIDLSSEVGLDQMVLFYHNTMEWAEKWSDAIVGYAPGIMNEFEIKYTNNEFKWVIYTDNFKKEFQDHLKIKYGEINKLNEMLGINYCDFSEIELPIIDYNTSVVSVGKEKELLYTDFMEFRENIVVEYVSKLVKIIHAYDKDAIGYFGQFMFPIDAIYCTGVATKCSDIFDIAVIDYNYFDGYKETKNVYIPAFLTNLMNNLGYKKVITGLYFERVTDSETERISQDTLANIVIDGHSDGIEIGSMKSKYLKGIHTIEYKNVEKSNIAIYVGKWNYYKTHGEAEEYISYLSDAAVELYRDIQFELEIPVEVITDENVLRGDLENYKLVFLPSQIYVDDTVKKMILDYGNKSGKLIQDFRFGECNEQGDNTADWGNEVFDIGSVEAFDNNEKVSFDGHTVKLFSKYEALPSYYRMSSKSGCPLIFDKVTGIQTDRTIVWGFQPQLMYKETNDNIYLKIIYDSIVRLCE